MDELDLARLLDEISPDSPCGENLEEDTAFLQLEDEARFVEERQMGDTILAAEEPDWKVVRNLSLGLLEKTRDIQIAMHLTTALIRTDGFQGLDQGLTLMNEWLRKYWDTVYPVQDPEDDSPILRINTLNSLNDFVLIRKPLNFIPLTQTPLGNYCWQDIEIAEGKKPAPKEGELTEMPIIDAAFNETDFEALKSLEKSIKHAEEQAKEIIDIVIEKADAINAPDLLALISLLQNIHKFVEEKIQYKENLEGISSDDTEGVATSEGGESIKRKKAGINSREDVKKAIDEICNYFERNEPSSPVPLMLLRAKKMVTMDFMEILRDMTPEGVSQAETICGIKNDEEN